MSNNNNISTEAYKTLLFNMFGGTFNASDFFNYACADAVMINESDFHWMLKYIDKYGQDGFNACMAYIQNTEPIKPFLKDNFNAAIKELIENKQEVDSDYDLGDQYSKNGPYRIINEQ